MCTHSNKMWCQITAAGEWKVHMRLQCTNAHQRCTTALCLKSAHSSLTGILLSLLPSSHTTLVHTVVWKPHRCVGPECVGKKPGVRGPCNQVPPVPTHLHKHRAFLYNQKEWIIEALAGTLCVLCVRSPVSILCALCVHQKPHSKQKRAHTQDTCVRG